MRFYFPEYLQGPARNLWLFKLRSALALLSMLVGTASVVALLSTGQLASQQALNQFKNLGVDLFAINIADSSSQSPHAHLNELDLRAVHQIKESSSAIKTIAPYTIHYAQISYAGSSMAGNIVGVTEHLKEIAKIDVAKGRFISDLDGEQFFCVIGHDIAQNMVQQGTLNPIGKQLRIGKHYCTVVGVAEIWPENMFMYANINNAVLLPIQAALSLDKSVKIQNLLLKVTPESNIDQLQQEVEVSITRLLPDAKIFSHSARQLIEGVKNQRRIFTFMLGSIGSISLIVAGIGVMNIMLVSVMERRREIGIRVALGARSKTIQSMFLTEAILLTLTGGVLGIIIGTIITYFISLFSHWPFSIYFFPPFLGFSIAGLIGVISGYYPAYKAAQLNPVETLRTE